MHRILCSFLLVCLLLPLQLAAQPLTDRVEGPVIDGYGETYPVNAPDFATPTDITYRVVFDVGTSPEAPEALNSKLNTVARFLNMHARVGVPTERMHLAVVLHGTAEKYALNHDAYRARYWGRECEPDAHRGASGRGGSRLSVWADGYASRATAR